MNVHCFQHVPFEGPGSIAAWARARGGGVSMTRWFAGETAPAPGAGVLLVVLGGPMGVSDPVPFACLASCILPLARYPN